MPTPVGHTLAALALRAASRELTWGTLADPLLWLAVVAANAPDFDFLPGLLLGNEGLYHRGAGHSLGGAFIFSSAVFAAVMALTRSWRKALPATLLASALFLRVGDEL